MYVVMAIGIQSGVDFREQLHSRYDKHEILRTAVVRAALVYGAGPRGAVGPSQDDASIRSPRKHGFHIFNEFGSARAALGNRDPFSRLTPDTSYPSEPGCAGLA
jgi:hypothetical protein